MVEYLIGDNLIHLTCVGDKESSETALGAVFLSSFFLYQSNLCPEGPAVSREAP